MFLQPYLHFDGRCDEALDFYKRALGAEVTFLMRYGECPDPQSKAMMTPGTENKVMHASVQIRDTQIMMSDGDCKHGTKFDGFTLTLNVSPEEADKVYSALAEGGQATMPPISTFFADKFGMLTDKFGVSWMILAAKKDPQ